MIRALCLVLIACLLAPFAALAECRGQDLLAALPAADRAALQARAQAVPFPDGRLWLARRGGQTVTLVGTYHLDDPRNRLTLAALAPALQAAHTLLVEAGPQEMEALQARMLADPGLVLLPPGQSLYARMDRDSWTRLSQALALRGVPAVMAMRMRPWYVTMILSASVCGTDGLQAGGLDMMLMTAAKDRALPVRGLEPAETVFDIFNALPMEDQLAMLDTALAEERQAQDMVVTLANAYFQGQTRLMWEFSGWYYEHSPGLDPAEARRQMALTEAQVLIARNRAWIPVIEQAAQDGPVLAAFGALHLPGTDGVLNLMARSGWTLTPLPEPQPRR